MGDELYTNSSMGTSGGILKQSLANVNNQFIDNVFSWTCIEVPFYFKYAATHILIGLPVAAFHQ